MEQRTLSDYAMPDLDVVRGSINRPTINTNNFKIKPVFKRKFMGEQYMEACKHEFLDLVQGNLFVADYELKFVRLSQYAPKMVLSKTNRCKRFCFGLNHEIQVYLVAQNAKLLDELVEKTNAVKETLVELPRFVVTKSGKRTSDGASGRPPKRGRRHPGEFRKLTGGCFKCGLKEHMLRDCPNRVEVSQLRVLQLHLRLLEAVVVVEVEFGRPTWVYAVRELDD
ncbi:uncharacterized protein LOC128032552 [Gossypium raimondii]|uniref:uncharacterized protein LOC128032552 n=1 Tax=Gossypium raimondii TaxID=29730 RepID=UPI00227C2ACF|nr:uncharacterized protein LOC128032552 [Gossypium raimondii]